MEKQVFDFEEATVTINPKQHEEESKTQTSKSPNTTLTINAEDRNMLKAFVVLGKADNLKDALKVVINDYYEELPEEDKKMADLLTKSLNQNINYRYQSLIWQAFLFCKKIFKKVEKNYCIISQLRYNNICK